MGCGHTQKSAGILFLISLYAYGGCPEELSRFSESKFLNSREIVSRSIGPRKSQVAYPNTLSVENIRLPSSRPRIVSPSPELSAGLMDPVLEEARTLRVFEDFKWLSDLRPRDLSASETRALVERARKYSTTAEHRPQTARRRAFLKTYIEGAYVSGNELTHLTNNMAGPRRKIKTDNSMINETFAHIEGAMEQLIYETPSNPKGSLLPSPYPVLIASPGRFHEAYYWDTYFGVKGCLATGRLELAKMQAENLLHAVQTYGFVPNGMRDYYLSRSQPPFLSSLISEVYMASQKSASPQEKKRLKQWLRVRAYPLMKADYEYFWMDPHTRYDLRTGLNHHWDFLDLPRPERHAYDEETTLGNTFRDVRSAAESGLDFTHSFEGEASQVAGVLLNSLLYKTETDLRDFALTLGLWQEAQHFSGRAQRRRHAIDQHLWNSRVGQYENYHLGKHRRIEVLTASTFAPLYVGLATRTQAAKVKNRLSVLESPGGIAASELKTSPHQWDGTNGWAPFQIMAMGGLSRYGFSDDAKRIANKWVTLIAEIHQRTGSVYERMDVETRDVPPATLNKYPVQTGFLWTDASFAWALTEILKVPLQH